MTIFGVDLSSHNAGVTIADLQAAGLDFCTARAVSFPWNGSTPEMVEDPNYAAWRDEAAHLGFPFAAYCLFHTYFTPTAQASFLASIIGNAGIPVLLDYEPDSDSPTLAFIEECFDACKVANLSPVPLYDPHWWWASSGEPNLTGRPWKLVSSSYGGNPKGSAASVYAAGGGDKGWPGWAAYGGLTPVVGQFGSQIEVGQFLLDGDAFKGTVAELIATGMFTDWGDPMTLFGQTQVDQLKAIYDAVAGPVDQGTTNLASEVAADLSADESLVNKTNALSALLSAVGVNVQQTDTDVKAAEAAVEAQLAALPAAATPDQIATALVPLLTPTDAAAVVAALGAAITKGSSTS